MKKYLVIYTKHRPYDTGWKDEEGNKIIKEDLVTRQIICVYADNEEEAAEMVVKNIKYSFTDYNTIDRVVEVTNELLDVPDSWLWNINHPVNQDGDKNWELDKRQTLF